MLVWHVHSCVTYVTYARMLRMHACHLCARIPYAQQLRTRVCYVLTYVTYAHLYQMLAGYACTCVTYARICPTRASYVCAHWTSARVSHIRVCIIRVQVTHARMLLLHMCDIRVYDLSYACKVRMRAQVTHGVVVDFFFRNNCYLTFCLNVHTPQKWSGQLIIMNSLNCINKQLWMKSIQCSIGAIFAPFRLYIVKTFGDGGGILGPVECTLACGGQGPGFKTPSGHVLQW